MDLLILFVVSGILIGYAAYVSALIVRADFYSKGQKTVQCLLIWLLPLVGAVVAHWVFRLHHAKPDKRDRAFIPQREPQIDEMRAFHHRHVDNGNP